MAPKYDVFISYSSTDLPLAEDLFRRLTGAGFRVWFDKVRLQPGYDWHREIEAGCDASRVILPVLTPAWKQSDWCRYETYGAERVIPLLFSGEWSNVATPPLRSYQFIDLRDRSPANLESVCGAIRKYLSEPAPHKAGRLALLPYTYNPHFVGREQVLLQLHEQLHTPPTTALTQAQAHAIIGGGGVGKTTLAREYAEKFWRLYQDILWISGTPATLVTEFARLAVDLKLTSQPSQDAHIDARRALAALNDTRPRLLIIDNAEDEESVQQWLPTAGHCRTLITSRFNAWSPAVQSARIDVLERPMARQLLLASAHIERSETAIRDAEQLADLLGDLPLALEQAAAFIRTRKVTCRQYIQLYSKARRQLLAARTLGSTQYPASVATTWLTSIKRLSADATAMLRLTSFLASDNVPIFLFNSDSTVLTTSSPSRSLLALFSRQRSNSRNPHHFRLRAALGELADYSLITLRNNAYSIHRLVQAVQMDSLSFRRQRALTKRAVVLLQRSFPQVEYATLPLAGQLFPHALAAIQHAQKTAIRLPQLFFLTTYAASYLQLRGQYTQAAPLFSDAFRLSKNLLFGSLHPNHITALNNLANVRLSEGKYAEAEKIFLRAIAKQKYTRSPSSPSHPRNGLAVLYARIGKYDLAEDLQRRELRARAASLGTRHPLYTEALNNLGTLYMDFRRYAEAEALYVEAIEIHGTQVSDSDPKYAQLINNLAVCYYRQQKYAQAEPLYQRALEIRSSALGDKHPELAYILMNLGTLYRATARYDKAEDLYDRALNIRLNTFGEGHPLVAELLTRMALLEDAKGNHTTAVVIHKRALDNARVSLDEHNPVMLEIMENYAASLKAANCVAEAQALSSRVDTLREKSQQRPS